MPARPMISVAATTGLTEAIVAAGGRPDEILRAVGLGRSALANPHGFIACVAFTRLLEEAARSTGELCFGLHFGEHFSPRNVGPLAYVALNSPTFAVGFENIVRYHRVHNDGVQMSFAIEGQWACARSRLTDPTEAPRQHNEFSSAVALNMMRLMAGSRWAPAEVHFAHPPPRDTSEHLRVFAAPVSFDHETNAFVIAREFAERPVPAADSHLYPILKRYLDRTMKELPREDGALAAVRKVIAESMRDGDPTLARVARRLAMSPRTLQRRLAEHATDFKRLVEDTRRRFSTSYLRDPKQTLTEIAFMLGYSEVSAFNRAFKRWTGSTPSDYRRTARA